MSVVNCPIVRPLCISFLACFLFSSCFRRYFSTFFFVFLFNLLLTSGFVCCAAPTTMLVDFPVCLNNYFYLFSDFVFLALFYSRCFLSYICFSVSLSPFFHPSRFFFLVWCLSPRAVSVCEFRSPPLFLFFLLACCYWRVRVAVRDAGEEESKERKTRSRTPAREEHSCITVGRPQ